MKDGKLQIGFIGCGGIAFNKHFPSLQALPDLCDMVAFCDIVEERAVKAAKEYGAPGAKTYTDYNEMLKDDSIDVVHVLTPNVVHAPATVAAFEAGKHVLCEISSSQFTCKIRVFTKIFKISAAKRTSLYIHSRSQNHVYSKRDCFLSQC